MQCICGIFCLDGTNQQGMETKELVYVYAYINIFILLCFFLFVYLFISFYLFTYSFKISMNLYLHINKPVLQQWQWIVFLGAKPAQDEKQYHEFQVFKQHTLT